jgi:hypothetical protein
MLTNQELRTARDNLRAANVLLGIVRGLYLGGDRAKNAMLLNDVAGLIGDEIAALDKEIASHVTAPQTKVVERVALCVNG